MADELNTTVESADNNAEKVDEDEEEVGSPSQAVGRSDPRYQTLLSALQELFDAKGDAVSIDELQSRLNTQSSDFGSAAKVLPRRR